MERKGYDTVELKADSTSSMTIDEAYEKAGLNSCYHIMLMIAAVIGTLPHLILMYSLPDMDTFPRVRGCPDLRPTSVCANATAACAGIYTYENKHMDYITELDLICDSVKAAWLGRSYHIGGLFSSFFLAILGDIFGRLRLLLILICISMFFLVIVLIMQSYAFVLIGLIVCGGCQAFITISFWALLLDTVHRRNVHVYMTLCNILDCLGNLIAQFLKLGNTPWRITHTIICLCGSIFFFFLIWLRESPRFLLSKGNDSEAINNLRAIAQVNGRRLPDQLLIKDERKVVQKALGCGGMLRLFSQGWVLKQQLLFMYMSIIGSFLLYNYKHSLSIVSPVSEYQTIAVEISGLIAYCLSLILYRFIARGQLLLAFGLNIIALILYYCLSEHPLLRDVCYIVSAMGTVILINTVLMLAAFSNPTAIRNTLNGLILFSFCFGALFPVYLNLNCNVFIWFMVGACCVGFGVALYVCCINFEDP